MKKQYASFQRIENSRMITQNEDYEFLYLLQNGLLLALKEKELLTPMQYRYAEEKLKQQYHEYVRKQFHTGENCSV